MKTSFNLPHFVDESTETVYVHVRSWTGALAASHLGAKHFGPNYSIQLVSEERLNDLKNIINEEE